MTMTNETKFTDKELLYAATVRCSCGAGVAYPIDHTKAMELRAWVCSSVLRGEVQGKEHDSFDFATYKIREETSINNHGAHTTRPAGTRCLTQGTAICQKCQHTWQSEPYVACGQGHHWFGGPCPGCGNAVGTNGSYSTREGPRVEHRYRNVVLEP